MAIGKMAPSMLKDMDIDAFDKMTSGAKVVRDPTLKGKTQMRFKNDVGMEIKVRMSDVAAKFAELGKEVTPEDADIYMKIGQRLQNLEGSAAKTEKGGVLDKLVTGIRTAFEKVIHKKGGREARLGHYAEGLKKFEKPAVKPAKSAEEVKATQQELSAQEKFLEKFRKAAKEVFSSSDDIESVTSQLENAPPKDVNHVIRNLADLNTALRGKKLITASMQPRELNNFIRDLASENYDPSSHHFLNVTDPMGKMTMVTISKDIDKPGTNAALDRINKLKDRAFKNVEGGDFKEIVKDLDRQELQDKLKIIEDNLNTLVTHVNEKFGIAKYIDLAKINPSRTQNIFNMIGNKEFKPEDLKLKLEENTWFFTDIEVGGRIGE